MFGKLAWYLRLFLVSDYNMIFGGDYMIDNLTKQIKEWEYCYCKNCRCIRYSSELQVIDSKIQCMKCGSFDLEAPGWVVCPHQKASAVKCPRSGRDVKHKKYAYECENHCHFRKGGK